MDYSKINTLGKLKKSNWVSKSIKDEAPTTNDKDYLESLDFNNTFIRPSFHIDFGSNYEIARAHRYGDNKFPLN